MEVCKATYCWCCVKTICLLSWAKTLNFSVATSLQHVQYIPFNFFSNPLTLDDGARWLMHHFIPDCSSLTTSGHYWIPMKFPWYPWSHVDESQWVWWSTDFTWSTTHRQKSAYLYIYELIYKIGTNVWQTLMVHSWWILLMPVILCLILQCHEEVDSFVFWRNVSTTTEQT